MLCRAYVNATTNPIVGSDQKLKDFWADVKAKFEALYASEGIVEEEGTKEERSWEALQTRFTKKIQPEMFLWNPFYKRIADCPPSGVPKEEWPNKASEAFWEEKGCPFKFPHCVDILHQLPKFNPMEDDDQSIDITGDDASVNDGHLKPKAKPKTNRIGQPMGSNMTRPMGQKAAKRLAKEEISMASMASMESSKIKAFTTMADAHKRVAASIDRSTQVEALKAQVEDLKTQYMILKDMGDMEGTATILAKIRALTEAAEEASTPVAPPTGGVLPPIEEEEAEEEASGAAGAAAGENQDPPLPFIETVEDQEPV